MKSKMRTSMRALAAVCLAAAPTLASAAVSCRAESGDTVLPHVELYTSEGCDSCPPADAWLARTFAGGADSRRAAVLAFHVDYWDGLGWRDRFGSADFTGRQQHLAALRDSRLVYTPQVLIQGRDRGLWHNLDDGAFAAIAATRARARLAIAARDDAGDIVVDVTGKLAERVGHDVRIEVALTEDALASAVSAGENAGRRLVHDHVVRALRAGPAFDAHGVARGSVRLRLPQERGVHPAVIAFAEDARTGEVLQSVVAACSGS